MDTFRAFYTTFGWDGYTPDYVVVDCCELAILLILSGLLRVARASSAMTERIHTANAAILGQFKRRFAT